MNWSAEGGDFIIFLFSLSLLIFYLFFFSSFLALFLLFSYLFFPSLSLLCPFLLCFPTSFPSSYLLLSYFFLASLNDNIIPHPLLTPFSFPCHPSVTQHHSTSPSTIPPHQLLTPPTPSLITSHPCPLLIPHHIALTLPHPTPIPSSPSHYHSHTPPIDMRNLSSSRPAVSYAVSRTPEHILKLL